MTVTEFHIGLDLLLKILKSEIYGSLQPDQKDYYLNLAAIDLITEKTKNIRDRYSTQENTPLARNFYSELGNLIIVKSYSTYTTDYSGSTVLALPRIANVEVDSGLLLEGERYAILERGSTNLSSVTTTTPLVNGSEFTVTATGSILPSWDGITTLERVSDPFMLVPLMVDTNIVTDISFSLGSVIRGNKYFTSTGAMTSIKASTLFITDTDVSTTPVRMAINSGTFDGSAATTTTLVKLNEVPANFMLPTERTILASDPASNSNNPVAIIHSDSVIIYCNSIIHSAMLTYIKMPRKINSDLNINTDISPILHKDIIDRAAKLILGLNNDPSYNVIKPQPS